MMNEIRESCVSQRPKDSLLRKTMVRSHEKSLIKQVITARLKGEVGNNRQQNDEMHKEATGPISDDASQGPDNNSLRSGQQTRTAMHFDDFASQPALEWHRERNLKHSALCAILEQLSSLEMSPEVAHELGVGLIAQTAPLRIATQAEVTQAVWPDWDPNRGLEIGPSLGPKLLAANKGLS